MRNAPFFLSMLLFALQSCDQKKMYSKMVTLPEKGWHKDSLQKFQVAFRDTARYDLFLILKNNDLYKFQNIFLIVTFQNPNNGMLKDTLEYQMADFRGNWLGEGFGSKTSRLFYKENITLPKGNYTLSVGQAVREVAKERGVVWLEGISEVGLEIVKSKN